MKVTSKSGAAIAAAAATLFLAGMSLSTVAQAADGKCMGANACKGQKSKSGQAGSSSPMTGSSLSGTFSASRTQMAPYASLAA